MTTQPVKSKTANALGFYDMSGNGFEWVYDAYLGVPGPPRMLRGGGWNYGASPLQVGNNGNYSNPMSPTYSFRLARSP